MDFEKIQSTLDLHRSFYLFLTTAQIWLMGPSKNLSRLDSQRFFWLQCYYGTREKTQLTIAGPCRGLSSLYFLEGPGSPLFFLKKKEKKKEKKNGRKKRRRRKWGKRKKRKGEEEEKKDKKNLMYARGP